MAADESEATEQPQPEAPLLRIVTPSTTPEEVAAIVAVFSAMSSGADDRPRRRRTEWNSPYRQVRPFYSHGPGGWRSSGLPKHRGRGT